MVDHLPGGPTDFPGPYLHRERWQCILDGAEFRTAEIGGHHISNLGFRVMRGLPKLNVVLYQPKIHWNTGVTAVIGDHDYE